MNDFDWAVGVEWVVVFVLYNLVFRTGVPALVATNMRHVLFYLHRVCIVGFRLLS